jgi:hypothetical protein
LENHALNNDKIGPTKKLAHKTPAQYVIKKTTPNVGGGKNHLIVYQGLTTLLGLT